MVEQVKELVEAIFYYLMNPSLMPSPFFNVWWLLRFIFFLISAFFIGMLFFLLSVNDYLKYRFKETYTEFKKAKPYTDLKIRKDWKEVIGSAKSENEAERKIAVIEADEMIDDILFQMGYEGENLLEKLEGLSKEIIPNIEELRDAHRERRDIVYDPSKKLSQEEAVRVVSVYEETFKDLQIF